MEIVAGIVLVILACVLWFGHISLEHSLAITIGVVGVLVLLGALPSHLWRKTP